MISRCLLESLIFAYRNYDTYSLLTLNVHISVISRLSLTVTPVDAAGLRSIWLQKLHACHVRGAVLVHLCPFRAAVKITGCLMATWWLPIFFFGLAIMSSLLHAFALTVPCVVSESCKLPEDAPRRPFRRERLREVCVPCALRWGRGGHACPSCSRRRLCP